jgi:hypothetical protein
VKGRNNGALMDIQFWGWVILLLAVVVHPNASEQKKLRNIARSVKNQLLADNWDINLMKRVWWVDVGARRVMASLMMLLSSIASLSFSNRDLTRVSGGLCYLYKIFATCSLVLVRMISVETNLRLCAFNVTLDAWRFIAGGQNKG